MRLALQIESSTAGDTMGEIEVQWTDAAPIGDGETLDNLIKKKNLGWSVEQLQRDYGLTDKQIETWRRKMPNGRRPKWKDKQSFLIAA
jgi:hypothetical protein